MTLTLSFLHIGLPKTASTWLQTGLFRYHPALFTLGKGAHHGHPLNELDAVLRTSDSVHADWRRLWDEHAATLPADKVIGLSNEHFGRLGLQSDKGLLIAEHVRALVEGTVKVIIVVRHPFDQFDAQFLQTQRTGIRTLSLDEHFAAIQQAGSRLHRETAGWLNHPRLIAHYREVFGVDNVLLLPYERLRDDETDFVARITAFLGVSPWQNSYLQDRVPERNARISARGYAIMRQANKARRLLQRLTGSEHTWIKRTALSFVETNPLMQRQPLPEKTPPARFYAIPELDALLRDENYAFWTGDLAKYNYTFPR